MRCSTASSKFGSGKIALAEDGQRYRSISRGSCERYRACVQMRESVPPGMCVCVCIREDCVRVSMCLCVGVYMCVFRTYSCVNIAVYMLHEG